MSLTKKLIGAMAAMALLPVPALAAPAAAADSTWIMIATAMVMLITPGFAFFYAGAVRSKNVVSTLGMSIISLGVIGLLWSIIGYSVAYSTGDKYIGDAAHYMLRGVDGGSMMTVMFTMMIAILAPAILSGAIIERVRFQSWLLIIILWSLAVFAPVIHWMWTAGGFLAAKGAQDFAGGAVISITVGFSALAAAIVIGKRRDFGSAAKPYNLGMTVMGTTIIWFGWFGLTTGMAGAAATTAFINTFMAASASMVMWVLIDHIKGGKPTVIGACSGAVAGLVAITAGAGYVTAESAIIIGLIAGLICNHGARYIRGHYGIDDSLSVFGCHGIGGIIGMIAVGFLGSAAIGGADGSMNGGDTLLGAQATASAIIAIYSVFATYIILRAVGAIMPIRVSDAEEKAGLDAGQHGEVIDNHD